MAKEKPLATDAPQDAQGEKGPRIRRGRVASVDLYEIKDSELDYFEQGPPSDIQLNFAVFLLSVAFTSLCTLASATFHNETIKLVFLLVAIIGVILGGYFAIVWWRSRISMRTVCRRIRERIPPDTPPAAEAPEEVPDPKDTEPTQSA